MTPTQRGWKRVHTEIGIEYVHACGASVYQYAGRGHGWSREWGCKKSTDGSGSGGFRSMREAMLFIEKHDPRISA